MSYSNKIASATTPVRRRAGFWQWAIEKLMASHRAPGEKPSGPQIDGQFRYLNPNRTPSGQSSHEWNAADRPQLPGGVHHLRAANYYLGRDGRHTVEAPKAYYAADDKGALFRDNAGAVVEKAKAFVSRGPAENFGLRAPTPGVGVEWRRSLQDEQPTQRNSETLAQLERYDRFAKPTGAGAQ